MPTPYNHYDWYWDVTDSSSGTAVYSSKKERWVLTTDVDYTVWQGLGGGGNVPTVIATRAMLATQMNGVAIVTFVPGSVTLNISADVNLTNIIPSVIQANNTTTSTWKLILPSTLSPKGLPVGDTITVRNVSTTTGIVQVYLGDGTTQIASIEPGIAAVLTLKDNNPAASIDDIWGKWEVNYIGNVVAATSPVPVADELAGWTSATRIRGINLSAGLSIVGKTLTLDADLINLAGFSSTGVWVYRKNANDWQAVTVSTGLSFNTTSGVLTSSCVLKAGDVMTGTLSVLPAADGVLLSGATTQARFQATGSSADVGCLFGTKGAGGHYFYTNAFTNMQVSITPQTVAGYVNLTGGDGSTNIQLLGGATGNKLGINNANLTGATVIAGIIDGSSAAAGKVGEFVDGTHTGYVALTNGVTANIASVVIPSAGEWMVVAYANINLYGSGDGGRATVSDSTADAFGESTVVIAGLCQPGAWLCGCWTGRIKTTGSKTKYLNANCTVSGAGTPQAGGTMWAMRIR